ncbi:alpha-L-fucosidase [Mucilaginibacter sp. RCC_168]|uniref:alpha-L-fucosidase n=1 Tax=Mucilaginibacter sp. RCC_168 TaxID=3239221 RepID=UPI0035266792
MRLSVKTLLLLILILSKIYCLAAPVKRVKHPKELHFGIFFHYLNGLQNTKAPWNQGKVTSWNDCVNDLNVNKIADQLAAIHADYVVITSEQIDKYFCFPNTTYEQLTGYKRGEATSQRDLVSDLYAALNKKGIKLFLYVTGDGPRADGKASLALNNPSSRPEYKGIFKVDELWVKSWSRIIRSVSLQYGKKITGWWFDGSYNFIGYNDALLKNYMKAAQAGNQKALVAFNFLGPKDVVGINTIGNFIGGESDKFESLPSPEFKTSKIKWHILSYLGNGWAQPGLRYTDDYMSTYIKKIRSFNGMITVDVCLLRDGTIDATQYDFLKRLKN